MPRASPMTGMIVARMMPLVATDACVSCVSCGFQPLLELSAERVNHGSMVDCAAEVSVTPRRNVVINKKDGKASSVHSPGELGHVHA